MATTSGLQVLADSFATWTDPRIPRTRWYKLVDIVMIAVCGAICECNSREDLSRYRRAKKRWLERFLELPQGIPSADTFARVFQRLKPDEFLRCLSSVVAVLRRVESQELVAIGGQTLRGSGDDRTGRHPRHLVRACVGHNQPAGSGPAGVRREIERDHRHSAVIKGLCIYYFREFMGVME